MLLFNEFHSFTLLDDDNRVTLKPLSEYSDCQRDYINASYVDVSSKINYMRRFFLCISYKLYMKIAISSSLLGIFYSKQVSYNTR